ncbi:hypothetical protein [Emticicia sp. 17c]|uniref:hypothetical protein n=1 Tax=Emticicia sp. 17c TaxID=3127704 RepID=UPI00301C94F0
MTKTLIIILLAILSCDAQTQKKDMLNGGTSARTVNDFLEGYAWIYEKNDNYPHADQSFWIYNDNKLYFIKNNNKLENGIDYLNIAKYFYGFYCFFPRTPFPYIESARNNVYTPIPKDSVFLDMPISSTKMNEIFILEGLDKIEEAYTEMQYRAMSYSFSLAQSNYIETNRAWLPVPGTIGGTLRIIEPPKPIQDFIKYLRRDKLKKIVSTKSDIYNNLRISTKMYLIKEDEGEILEEKNDWLKIRYYGKKTIEGWIKKSDVETN